jgi:glycosyltransferase involved in cell wall biosynthesis
LRGIPTVAFAVGGITDWLRDGVNGYLASGDPPCAANLAEGIVKCLRSSIEYDKLRRGALGVSKQFTLKSHLFKLLRVLENVASVS